MALIKGSKVDQGGSVVVAGDQVIADEGEGRPGRVRRRVDAPESGLRRAERVVPMAESDLDIVPLQPESPGPEAPARPVDPVASAGAGVAEPAPGGAAAGLDAALEADGDWLAGFEGARQEILTAAEAAAQAGAEEAANQAPDPEGTFSALLEAATQRLSEALGADPQQLGSAVDALVPTLEQQAAAAAEFEAARAASRARWRELASAEEQIAALLDGFELKENAGKRLLAERERLLAEARLEAERIVGEAQIAAAEARADAQNQIAQAFEDFERSRSERYEQMVEAARAAGYTEGRAQADEEGAKIIEEAIETLNRARLAYPQAARENSRKLIQLAMSVAEKIVCDEISAKPEIVLSVLDEALTRVTDLERVVVRVNTEDLPQVQAQEDRFRDMLAQVKHLEFQASNKIQRGGVFIETGSGTVDATIKTQLSVLQEVFQNVQRELSEVDDAESQAFEDLNQ